MKDGSALAQAVLLHLSVSLSNCSKKRGGRRRRVAGMREQTRDQRYAVTGMKPGRQNERRGGRGDCAAGRRSGCRDGGRGRGQLAGSWVAAGSHEYAHDRGIAAARPQELRRLQKNRSHSFISEIHK